MPESSTDVIKRYLADAIAAGKSFEAQLNGFSKEGGDETAMAAFRQHAVQTKQQHERLTARLNSLGDSSLGARTFLAHIFGLSPKVAQIGHEKDESTTQNLIMAYAVENSEVAMYESLATVAEAASDPETAELARSIQAEEQAMAQRIWNLMPTAALGAYQRVTGESSSGHSASIA